MSRRQGTRFPPELVPRFEPRRVLGEGMSGVVFLAQDTDLERLVAIKVHRMNAPEGVADRFLREAETLARLVHPHLVQVYAAGEVEAGPYLVMEYLDGRVLSLSDTGTKVVPVLLDVAGALEEVHAAGLIHRDVKPSNIMVAGDGRGVLMDLGCVHDPGGRTLTGTGILLGTEGFMAPEGFRGDFPDPSWDWYAWGATLFYCLYGTWPHRREDLLAYAAGRPLAAVVPPQPWPHPGVEAAVTRCLSVYGEDRPSSRRELERLLRGYVAGSDAAQVGAPSLGPAASARLAPVRTEKWERTGGVRRALPWVALFFLMVAAGWVSSTSPPSSADPGAAPVSSPVPVVLRRPPPGPFLIPDRSAEGVDGGAQTCVGENSVNGRGSGRLFSFGEGKALGVQWQGYYLVADVDEPLVQAAYLAPPGYSVFPAAEGKAWLVRRPGGETLDEAPILWEPREVQSRRGLCLPRALRLAVDERAPREAGVSPKKADQAWATTVGAHTTLELTRDSSHRRFLVATGREAPRLLLVDDPPGWRQADLGQLARPGQFLVVDRGVAEDRVMAVSVTTGAVAWRLGLTGRLEGPPVLGDEALFALVSGEVRRYELESLDTGHLEPLWRAQVTGEKGWLPGQEKWSHLAWAGASGLHLLVAHQVAVGREPEVPVLSWYAFGAGTDPGAPRRFRVPRPPASQLVPQSVQAWTVAFPEDDGFLWVCLNVAWHQVELLALDLGRGRIAARLEAGGAASRDLITSLRAAPIVVGRGPRARLVWQDSLGLLYSWPLRMALGSRL